jgi:DNA modification methylase
MRRYTRDETTIYRGDCLDVLPTIPAASVDAIITDPPYPEIDRPYGRLTEAAWWDLMMGVCREARRVLKPSGSAVFILQPNSRKVGSMRGWLWRFMAWACDEWNMVQDAWWWNTATLPNGGATKGRLLRSSLKACVWLGPSDCYRDQSEVLDKTVKPWMRRSENLVNERIAVPSGNGVNRAGCLATVLRRGGSIPFNVIAMGPGHMSQMAGCYGHGAGTPLKLADWWVRYICPPGGLVLDPFAGIGTIPLAALARGRSAIAIEKHAMYWPMLESRTTPARSLCLRTGKIVFRYGIRETR